MFFFVLPFKELEVQEQMLQEGSRGASFCGPKTEKHTTPDCISVPHHKIQDLHNNGRKMLQDPIIFHHLHSQQSVIQTYL